MKKAISVVLILAFIFCIAGCDQAPSGTTRTIMDSAGDEVKIPTEVNTVINLSAYGSQVMVGLGLGDYLIGAHNETVESLWIVEMYPRIEEISIYEYETSAEVLLAANADVVFVEDAEYARTLRAKGVPAVNFSYYTIDEMKQTIAMLGEILGGDAAEKCTQYIEYLDANIALVAESLEGTLPQKETLYYINGVSNKGLYKTTGNGSTNCACAELSYTVFATASLIESPANRVDSEAILAVNPENIIIGGVYQHVLYDELLSTPEWSNNAAVQNGHVFKVPMGISAWNRYGIEIALMIPWTSAVVYPEYFEYDVHQATKDFYLTFASYELSDLQVQYILEGLTPSGEKEIPN